MAKKKTPTHNHANKIDDRHIHHHVELSARFHAHLTKNENVHIQD